MKVVIATWEDFVSDCPADLEITEPTILGVFDVDNPDHKAAMLEAQLAFAKGRAKEDEYDVCEDPPTTREFVEAYVEYGYFNTMGAYELGEPQVIYVPD